MRLVTFRHRDLVAPGVVTPDGGSIVDLTRMEGGVTGLLELADDPSLARRARAFAAEAQADCHVPAQEATILAPVPWPRRNILCVGKNYHEHAEEFHRSGFDASSGGASIPEHPIIFTKASTTVIGPGAPIPASADPTASVDYEAELAVVIGREGKSIPRDAAYDHVFGYTIVNDVTSRTIQQRHRQWFLGKNFDGFCPMGPEIVTADEIADVESLEVSAKINDELRQKAIVRDLIFDIPALIARISAVMTLLPGDIIATGTPSGVGIGFDPPRFLKPGDVCRVEIGGIGVLENPVL
jgi:2-keto-4-pentenoate hydratase/2-oxohepta-3-ene-1,7-dioic acid hydratase in catechol pathway